MDEAIAILVNVILILAVSCYVSFNRTKSSNVRLQSVRNSQNNKAGVKLCESLDTDNLSIVVVSREDETT